LIQPSVSDKINYALPKLRPWSAGRRPQRSFRCRTGAGTLPGGQGRPAGWRT